MSDPPKRSTRRSFLRRSAALSAALSLGGPLRGAARAADEAALPEPTPAALPRWRGFNLLEKFTLRNNRPFREQDFQWIAELGFDFVRLPMDYRCWIDSGDWTRFNEEQLGQIDRAVEHGREHGVHVSINFHRAPGYCVNPPAEPLDLWTDPEAQRIAALHWATFAERYRGVPNRRLSFDLVNEPARTDIANYVRVARLLVEAIRAKDPDRLIIADGHNYGREPVHGLADLGIAQSTRGYDPFVISHYKAGWVNGSDRWAVPTWPLRQDDGVWDKDRLRRERIRPWKELEAEGVGVHVGEWGAYNKTPHEVALAWMADLLDLWREAGWGWALWNFRGSFGVLDSGRDDVDYEDWRGHKLDRGMLELLRADGGA